ncbi:MAG TPA: GNAT family N-acetyltransferase [Sphingomonas sp.]|nr:GNAT family N-acetyltransferase [Sphingomonas sp.]
MSQGNVRDNRAEQEFELEVDGHRAIAAYQREGDRIVFTHTHVPKAIEGRGVGSKLIRAALDQVRDEGLKVVAHCPFVAAFIERHPEYRDLLVRG